MFSIRRRENCVKRLSPGTCLFTASMLFPVFAWAETPVYDALIIQARSGDSAPLLNYLKQQETEARLTPGQVADWLQVSAWSDNDAQTLAIWERYRDNMAIPARGQLAVARALRNQKKWDASLAVWDNVLREMPDDKDARAGWIMTLADARRNQEAITQATAWAKSTPGPESDAVLAYVYHAQGKNWDALLAASRAQALDPQNKSVQPTLLAAMSANRIAGPALELSEVSKQPDALARRLELDAAAQTVRTSFTPTRNEDERFLVADKALARYDALIAAWQDNPQAAGDLRRARIDRLGALVIRKRTAEAIREYESLMADGKPVPDYAKRWIASAWLTEEQPDKAEAMLEQIYFPRGPLPVTPLTSDDEQELFYARLDNNHFEEAKAQVDTLIKDSPYLKRVYGSPTPQPNDNWLLGQTLLTEYEIATNDLPAAETHAERLARTGSGNQALRITYAAVLLARGLPRESERELKLAEVIEPSNLALERQQAATALELQEWHQAKELTADVMARSPDDAASLRLKRILDVHEKAELRISGGQGIDSDSPISGQHDFTLNSALYSPPINDNWRVFTGFNFATGEFEEGKGISRDIAAGVEWTSRNNWAELEISGRNYGDGQKIGGRFSGWHDFNDNWRIGGSAERLSRNTPLRALRNGVSADGGDLWLRWYKNERREYAVSVSAAHFSDGNDRLEYSLSGKERLWTTPRFTLDFTPGLSGSHNTKEDVPYYNPERDFSLAPGLSAEHVIYRHYDTVWKQQFQAGAGRYWQKGQSSGAITQFGYGQRVQWNNVVDAGVMLTWDKRPYDGKRERNIALAFDLNVRF
ncbi:poly-beta-1,6 N-acetyl-D-glucosamine export porin PgaA [Enterobacter kobei]|uniref:Poly-beta-1,6 N-acetyl-D-glucosamine export porin PgaA n=1 Tax=Enterobacter kobei TaxID=208224 RepID=A0ACC8SCS5_9ENTR|nr:poly-beta-1,6 N-acetyl-D-glucosamine export porin PgaA [Enterobacter kobei]OLR21231.1 poly-beta-1,6 N-acetyl-D-glucosamine export porin PgaA [Enterobacter kobei]